MTTGRPAHAKVAGDFIASRVRFWELSKTKGFQAGPSGASTPFSILNVGLLELKVV